MGRPAVAPLLVLAWLAGPAASAEEAPAAPAAADPALTKEETAKVERWIDDLDHRDPARREAATLALRAFGRRGLAALRDAVKDGSVEQRARAGILVTVLDAGGPRTSEDDVAWGTLKGDMGRTSSRGGAFSRGPEVRRTLELGMGPRGSGRPLDAPLACAEGFVVVVHEDRVLAVRASDFRPAWEVGVGSDVTAAPVVSGGKVFVGTARGLVALRLSDGADQWALAASYGVAAAPLVTGGTVYACLANEAVVALDPETGAQRWQVRCDAGRAAPVLSGDRVVVGTRSGEVIALAAETGLVVWRLPVDGGVSYAPAAVGGSVVVGDGGRRLRCLDAASGKVLWGRAVEGQFRGDGPAVSASVILVATDRLEVEAYDPATGTRLWRRWLGTRHVSSPAIAGSVVLLGSRTRLVALAAESGDDLWRLDLEDEVASPLVSSGTVFALAGPRLVAVTGPAGTATPR